MNILQITEMLKRMPDADLQAMIQNPSSQVPSWAIVSETNQRNETRQGAQVGTGAPPTVAQQLTQQIKRPQLVTEIPQPGAQSQSRGIGSIGQGTPKGYAAGGIVTFGNGGLVAAAKTFGYDATDEADAKAWLEKSRFGSADPRVRTGAALSLQKEIEQQSGIRAAAEAQREAAIAADPSRLSRYTSRGELVRPGAVTPQAQAGIPAAIVPPVGVKKPQVAAQPPVALPTATTSQPGGAPSGLSSMRGPQIAMPEKPTLDAEVNVPTRAGELAAYYGEDEYGKALAVDLAERRKKAEAAREDSTSKTRMDLFLNMMATKDPSFMGGVGTAGLEALKGSRAREAAMSAEESAMGKEALGEVGRKQTEKRGYTTAALGEAKEVAKENRAALAKYADRVQDTTFKNAELKNTITGYLIQADTQLKSHTSALDRADRQQIEADRRAMGQLVALAQKDVEAAKDTPDYTVAKKAYEGLFNTYKSMLVDSAPGAKKGEVVADLTK